jgi:tetratricopeptide (TPR) repeat protein
MRQFAHRVMLQGLCVIAFCLIGAEARAADATMFDQGQAQRAFTAIQDKVGRPLRVLTLTIAPDALRLEIPNADKPGEVETWHVSHKGLAGALGVDLAVREGSARASLPGGGTIEESVIPIDAAGLAVTTKLAADALARARLQSPGRVTEMELMRLPKFLGPAARDPYWHIHVEAPEEDADISAKITGELTLADLRRTKRAETINLLAGGPDFDEMLETIRHEIKDQWVFHYIEIEKDQINFDVHLTGVKDPRITRFTASLEGVRTDNFSMPHFTFPGTPTDDPFTLADVDFGLVTKLEAAAKERLGIADGVVQRVIVSKPHRERDSAIAWQLDVKSAKAPLFPGLNSAPVEEGSVFFDAKGGFLHAKYPPGRGPQTNLFDAASIGKAIAKIGERLGPHVLVSELMITDTSINITAQDPQDPKKLVAFTYEDEDVSRASGPSQTVANAFPNGLDWLWDLALLQPSVVQSLPALEKQTMAKLGIANGAIERITISKDKMFHPANDKVLMEIRASGDGKDSDWVTYDLAGAIPKLDTPVSGIRVVGGNSGGNNGPKANPQDADDCVHGRDPEKVIAGCGRLLQDPNVTSENKAIAYFNRGHAHSDRKEFDLAVADNTEALKLNPQYAAAYMNRGFAYAAEGDGAHALADYNKSIELSPNGAIAYLNRGILHDNQHEADAAIADYTKAIQFDPNQMVPYFNRGLLYYAKRDYSGAVADFTKASQLSPNESLTFYCRGNSYFALGEFDKAVADYNQTIRLNPRDARDLKARANAYRRLNKPDLAIADYSQAIKLDANALDAYLARAFVYQSQGDLDRAIADESEAIKRNPKLAAAYEGRGGAYHLKGDLDKSVADYTTDIQLDPKSANAYFGRGFVFALAGAWPKALADLSQANALNPADSYLALLLDIVARRSKLPSRLGEMSGKLDMTAWPAPVIRLYLAQLTPEAVLAAADDPDPAVKRGKVCEANFYTAELSLLADRKDEATRLLVPAASDCPFDYRERQLAEAELKAMGVPLPQRKP